MKLRTLVTTTFSLVVVSVMGMLIASAQDTPQAPSQVPFRLVDLAEDGTANDITNCGLIVGSHNFGDVDRHAAFWRNIYNQPLDLGILPHATSGRGFGINSQRQMVGIDFPLSFTFQRALFWASPQSGPIELSGLPRPGDGLASDINEAGQIVGAFISADGSGFSPVFWASGNTPATFLTVVSNDFPNGQAFSINGDGNILGDACTADFSECHVAFWIDSMSTPVALASPGGDFLITDVGLDSDFNVAHALNNRGSMVGFAVNNDGSETRAVYWASSSAPAVVLSTNDDFPNGTASSINDRGQIIGVAYNADFSVSHGFFWASANSPGIDLNTLIPANSGYEVVVARSINDRGEIAGGALFNGTTPGHAIVLVPVRSDSAIEGYNDKH